MSSIKGTYEKISGDRYRLRYPIGINSKGNAERLSKNVDAKNDKEALMELLKWNMEIEKKGYTNLDKITFKAFYETHWLVEAKNNLESRTYLTNKSYIEDRFLEPLGNLKLKDIKPYQIKKIIVEAKRIREKDDKKELSRQTKKRILAALSNLFVMARDEYRIIDYNPCNEVRLPKEKNATKQTYDPYSENEIKTLFEFLETAPLRTQAIIKTAFFTAARQGEIAALEVKHLNFETNEVTFNQRIVQLEKQELVRVDGLKATESKTMVVPESYMTTMKAFIKENQNMRDRLNVEIPDHDYIFGSIDGKPVTPASLNRHWQRFAAKHGLRKIRFHDFRHTSATILINQNQPLKSVQERLGHKDYNTTINIYAHSLKETDKVSSDVLENLIK